MNEPTKTDSKASLADISSPNPSPKARQVLQHAVDESMRVQRELAAKADSQVLDELIASYIMLEAKDPQYVTEHKLQARREFKAAIQAYAQNLSDERVRESEVKHHRKSMDDLSTVCMFLVPKSNVWKICHELINSHLRKYQMLKFGKTSEEANAEWAARQAQLTKGDNPNE